MNRTIIKILGAVMRGLRYLIVYDVRYPQGKYYRSTIGRLYTSPECEYELSTSG